MKRFFVLAIALSLTVAAGLLAAPYIGAQETLQKRIWVRGAFGNGLAISQSDPMDFELIRIGTAGVKFTSGDNESVVNVGILYFGEDRYVLRDVVIGNASASANIYLNDTQVGSISLDSYPKGDREIWAGTLTLNGVTYNAYVIQAPRIRTALENAEMAKDYCKNNPERCKAAMKAVGNILCDPETDGNCRNRIRDFCNQTPEDSRCKALQFAYCKQHPEDADCRSELMGVCRNNSTEKACNVLVDVYNRNMQNRPEALQNAPQWFHTIRERIRERLENVSG